MDLVETVAHLFQLLDDIDSQDDVCKEDDAAFRKRVMQLQKLRWQTGIQTDGYKAWLPDGTVLPEQPMRF